MKIPLIKPYITEEIKKKVLEVLDSGFLTEGSVTREFETAFAEYVGAKHAIAVTSCTTGLEIALRALGIGPGDEVIVPDYTYPATASVVAIVGAHCTIIDVDPATMLIDYDKTEQAVTARTKAIIPVSLFGNPLDYDRLNELKKKYGFYIVEDAACSIGSEYKGKKVGTFADISVFSLHPRKFITTGEGGMIVTDNSKWAEWINSYKHFGIETGENTRESISFSMTGTNYKLSNIQAAVGLGQMEHIDKLLARRRELAGNYYSLLKGTAQVSFPLTTPGGIHSFQSFAVFINDRDRILKELRKIDIEVQIGTYALHMHKAFINEESYVLSGDYPGSTYAFRHSLVLPLYNELTFDDQQIVVDSLKSLL